MIFRCRWCERGFCEDCTDWEKTELLGDNLKEYELLEYPSVTQAYYVCCHSCTDGHTSNPAAKAFYDEQAADIDTRHRAMLEQDAKAMTDSILSDSLSLTDASTIDESAVTTPYCDTDKGSRSSNKKRKTVSASFDLGMTPPNRPGFGLSPCDSDHEGALSRATSKISPESKKTRSSKRVKLSQTSPRTPLRSKRS